MIAYEAIINKAALLLRKAIKSAQVSPFPENITLQDPSEEEVTSRFVATVFEAIYEGQNKKIHSPRLQCCGRSSRHDGIFIVQRGRVKPAKQLIMGMAVKSMTGNRTFIEMHNRQGHSISYRAIEELEISFREAILNMEEICPEGTPPGLAFDCFIELPETSSGSDTLHDTIGILC